MMQDLKELYQEVILDHNKRPRNFGALPNASHEAEGHNPLCGDQLKVYLETDGEKVIDIHFEGLGCAISKASASLMTEAVRGKSLAEIETLYRKFHDLLTGDPATAGQADEALGKLAVFSGVREFPVRVKCATLAWHTLQAALESQSDPVTTE
jgi:nitrogen fixation NifU-like protein